MTHSTKEQIFALYKGDRFIAVGTLEEISIETKKKVKTLEYMTYPSYQERLKGSTNKLCLVPLEENEMEMEEEEAP